MRDPKAAKQAAIVKKFIKDSPKKMTSNAEKNEKGVHERMNRADQQPKLIAREVEKSKVVP